MRRFVLFSVVFLGCGGDDGNSTGTEPDASSGTGSTAMGSTTVDPTTGTGSTTTDPTTGEVSGTTGGSTGSGGVCEDPTEPGGTSVTVTIHNERDAPIYLQSQSASVCAVVPPFEIKPGITMFLHGGEFCSWSCTSVLSGMGCGCPAGCGIEDAVLRLDPGGSVSGSWSGATYRRFTLDDSCGIVEPCSECQARVPAPARAYSVWVRVSDAAVDGVQSGKVWTVTADLDYPAQTTVEVIVQ